jgi:hypothetical protein
LGLLGEYATLESQKRLVSAKEPIDFQRLPGEPFALEASQPDRRWPGIVVIRLRDFQRTADRADGLAPSEFEESPWRALVLCSINLCFFPALWVLWAYAARGGLSLRFAGLALVRRNGSDAWRLQCLGRAVLVWLPVVALLGGVIALDLWAPELSWLCEVLQGLAALLLVVFAALAVRFPCRGPHDWLLGTYVVPR